MSKLAHRHAAPCGLAAVRGFGLLEAIVSLVLLAGTGAALFAWINQNLESASRLRQAQEAAGLSLTAQALIDDVNPALSPSGGRELPPVSVSWSSVVVQPMRDGAAFVTGQPSNWQIGLYRTKVQAEDRSSGTKITFTVLKLGKAPRPGTQATHER